MPSVRRGSPSRSLPISGKARYSPYSPGATSYVTVVGAVRPSSCRIGSPTVQPLDPGGNVTIFDRGCGCPAGPSQYAKTLFMRHHHCRQPARDLRVAVLGGVLVAQCRTLGRVAEACHQLGQRRAGSSCQDGACMA
jgi:hypothetical protein